MRPLLVSLMSMVMVAGLLGANTAHAERRIIILQDPGPQGPSLEMSAPWLLQRAPPLPGKPRMPGCRPAMAHR